MNEWIFIYALFLFENLVTQIQYSQILISQSGGCIDLIVEIFTQLHVFLCDYI